MQKVVHLSFLLIMVLFLVCSCESDKEQVNAPVEPVQYHGDINLNGVSDELADAVLFSNYFIYGSAVFMVDPDSQILATDVNKDGTPLTIADLVFLTRIVIGDTLAIPKVDSLTVRYVHKYNGTLSVMDDVKIGSAFVVVAGNNDSPQLLADNMDMEYAYDGANTRILVWSRDFYYGYIQSFTSDFLHLYGEIVSIEMASFEGQPVKLEEIILDSWALGQIVPNPLDSTISIFLILGYRADVSLIITNSEGQAVFKIHQYYDAGVSELVWDGNDYTGQPLPNGVYYCSMIVDGQIKTKEMLLQR